MTRSRLVKARAAANEQRIGTHVVTTTLNGKGQKFARALKAVRANNGSRPYMVMADAQGVGYLRVETLPKGAARFLLNAGSKIEVVEMDASTIRSRALKAVPEASILDAAKVLAQPLTDGVIISVRSKKYLDTILNDKELTTMATAKAKDSKKNVAKKSVAIANDGRSANTVVKFKKMAEEDSLPKQALGILKVIKSKGSTTVADLVKALEGKIETSQPVRAIWSFYRKTLIDGKYIEVAKAA